MIQSLLFSILLFILRKWKGILVSTQVKFEGCMARFPLANSLASIYVFFGQFKGCLANSLASIYVFFGNDFIWNNVEQKGERKHVGSFILHCCYDTITLVLTVLAFIVGQEKIDNMLLPFLLIGMYW